MGRWTRGGGATSPETLKDTLFEYRAETREIHSVSA